MGLAHSHPCHLHGRLHALRRRVPPQRRPKQGRSKIQRTCRSVQVNIGGVFLLSQTTPEGSRLVSNRIFSTYERFASHFLTRTRSVRPLRLCSDRNVRRNWTACHARLFIVFARLNAEWEFYGKACICSNLVTFSNVLVMI